MRYQPEERPFSTESKCNGFKFCDLCGSCARFTRARKDETFLLVAPGRGKKCPAYLKFN